MSTYADFIARKRRAFDGNGLPTIDLSPILFDWQRAITTWAIKKGRCALFADCGLGKSFMQLAWAHHVWYDIDATDTLNVVEARENDDERHICPLQLGLIERCVRLWSNPGELVLSPFAGIGSEGYEAVKAGRRFWGVELKEAYARVAAKNLRVAETLRTQGSLLDVLEA